MWLAEQGWQVTAIDFSATALDFGRARARLGAGRRGTDRVGRGRPRILSSAAQAFDLVVRAYVHVAESMTEALARLAGGVAPGGWLLLTAVKGGGSSAVMSTRGGLSAGPIRRRQGARLAA